jgi:2-polyprenyl-3-methyl-5-hydroxy-6-metoxy-1,4-benzoquinol methylase
VEKKLSDATHTTTIRVSSADPNLGLSPSKPLYTASEGDAFAAELRQMLALDQSAGRQATRGSQFGRVVDQFPWFQRIDFPRYDYTSTSNSERFGFDSPGDLNRLGGRLSNQEGSLLRPYPKWVYLRNLLPDLRGKSVLELGSSCGFFSFKFAECGARQVTGIEAIPAQVQAAEWSANVLGVQDRVKFLTTDYTRDTSIQQHDVVFFSEVLVHSAMPSYSLYRAVNLAKETLIIHESLYRDKNHPIDMDLIVNRNTGQFMYTGMVMTEHLLVKLLYVYGINPHSIQRFHDPHEEHTLLVIDTRDAPKNRGNVWHPCMQTMLDSKWDLPSAG